MRMEHRTRKQAGRAVSWDLLLWEVLGWRRAVRGDSEAKIHTSEVIGGGHTQSLSRETNNLKMYRGESAVSSGGEEGQAPVIGLKDLPSRSAPPATSPSCHHGNIKIQFDTVIEGGGVHPQKSIRHPSTHGAM